MSKEPFQELVIKVEAEINTRRKIWIVREYDANRNGTKNKQIKSLRTELTKKDEALAQSGHDIKAMRDAIGFMLSATSSFPFDAVRLTNLRGLLSKLQESPTTSKAEKAFEGALRKERAKGIETCQKIIKKFDSADKTYLCELLDDEIEIPGVNLKEVKRLRNEQGDK